MNLYLIEPLLINNQNWLSLSQIFHPKYTKMTGKRRSQAQHLDWDIKKWKIFSLQELMFERETRICCLFLLWNTDSLLKEDLCVKVIKSKISSPNYCFIVCTFSYVLQISNYFFFFQLIIGLFTLFRKLILDMRVVSNKKPLSECLIQWEDIAWRQQMINSFTQLLVTSGPKHIVHLNRHVSTVLFPHISLERDFKKLSSLLRMESLISLYVLLPQFPRNKSLFLD